MAPTPKALANSRSLLLMFRILALYGKATSKFMWYIFGASGLGNEGVGEDCANPIWINEHGLLRFREVCDEGFGVLISQSMQDPAM